MKAPAERHVGLLRGINVGGNKKIDMRSLAALFTDAGCRNVETYIQSGNVVFTSEKKAAEKIGVLICSRVYEQFGFTTQIVFRSLVQMQQVVAANPYSDVEKTHVMFLANQPTAEQLGGLDDTRSPGTALSSKAARSIFFCRMERGTAS